MKIVCDGSVREFLQEASDFLYGREAENSLLLGICEGVVNGSITSDPACFRFIEGGATVAAAVNVPDRNLLLTKLPAGAIVELAQALQQENIRPGGVVGPAAEAEKFAFAWSRLVGVSAELGMGQKIYRLDKVIPASADGAWRRADREDLETLAQWYCEFAKEALNPREWMSFDHWKKTAARNIEAGSSHLGVVNGRAVAMTSTARPTKNGVTINAVYTPPAMRGNGYASALVARVSQFCLDTGKKFCVLYTDLANPTSNKIYQNVGYEYVADSKHFLFA